MINSIKDYLEQKLNYLYFEKGKTTLINYYEREKELIMLSKLSVKHLAASDCYIVYKYNNKELKFRKLNCKKDSTYTTFNLNINKLLLSIIEKDYLVNNSDNLAMNIYKLLNELTQELKNTSNIFDVFFEEEKEENHDIKEMLRISNIKEYISDLTDPQKYRFDILSDELSKKEFYERYIRNMINKIEYLGIFYPCQFKHNFFANKYYEMDLSPIMLAPETFVQLAGVNPYSQPKSIRTLSRRSFVQNGL